jgi:hypothetical protein
MSIEERPALAQHLVLAVCPAVLIARVMGERERTVWSALAQRLTCLTRRYFIKQNLLGVCEELGPFHFACLSESGMLLKNSPLDRKLQGVTSSARR